jgi:lysophospholipase L1-like esterase
VRFRSDAEAIGARWTLTTPNLAMPNMAAIGVSGLDLYVRDERGAWRWLGVGQPKAQTNTAVLISGLPRGDREYLLYLPLYNGASAVELGVASNFTVRAAGAWGPGTRKPIVFYGTSITQGASASRPGMCHVAMLGRKFNWPTINLGFSGQGRMEPELAEFVAELDPAVFVLDCLPNMDAAGVRERVVPFVKRLRQAHPRTPIVLVEDRVYANAFLTPKRAAGHRANHEALRAANQQLQRDGIRNLHYVKGDDLLGDDSEGTVDGSHPNELGFARQAEAFAKVLKPLLKSSP